MVNPLNKPPGLAITPVLISDNDSALAATFGMDLDISNGDEWGVGMEIATVWVDGYLNYDDEVIEPVTLVYYTDFPVFVSHLETGTEDAERPKREYHPGGAWQMTLDPVPILYFRAVDPDNLGASGGIVHLRFGAGVVLG